MDGKKNSFTSFKNLIMRREKEAVKVVVLGSPKVGKTALLIRCLSNQFFNHYAPAKEESYRYSVNVGSRKVQFDIMDSNGKNSALISYADAVILVYSITDRCSYENVSKLVTNVRLINLNNVPIIVVANKIDLAQHRVVSVSDGESLSLRHDVPVMERSAKIPSEKIKSVFVELFNMVKSKRSSRALSVGDFGSLYKVNNFKKRISKSLDSKDFVKLIR